MNAREHRRPAAFRLDDPHVTVAPENADHIAQARHPADRGHVLVIPEPAPAFPVGPEPASRPRRRRMPWGKLFWSALGGLVALGLGLGVTQLIEDLFARAAALGYAGLALAIAAGAALLALVLREAAGLARLRSVEKLRARAAAAIAADDRDLARAVVRELVEVESAEPHLARARANLTAHAGEIIDGADLIRLAERELLSGLDEEARRLVAAAARRVSVVTAVSPRAAVDMAFVLINVLALVRRLGELYGARPGAIARLRLMRLAIGHLALTGGMAATDSLIQQVLGHGVAAKLSARLGEGVLNGLLTARLGLAAIDVIRPLPFAALPRPKLADLTADLVRRQPEKAAGSNKSPPAD